MQCLVSTQEAFCYLQSWGIVMLQFRAEGGPEPGDTECTRWREAEGGEERVFWGHEGGDELCAVHLGDLFIGAESSWEVRLGWDQMAGAQRASPPKSVGFWRQWGTTKVLCRERHDQSQPVFIVLPRQAWPSNHNSSTPYLRLWSCPLLLFTFWGVPGIFTKCHVISFISYEIRSIRCSRRVRTGLGFENVRRQVLEAQLVALSAHLWGTTASVLFWVRGGPNQESPKGVNLPSRRWQPCPGWVGALH